jgi:hypothetical protein
MEAPPSNPLPGVPLVESPFFRRFFNEATCDAETLRVARQLHTQGFAVIDFPDPEFAARAARIKADLHPRYEWDAWRAQQKDSLRFQDAWQFQADVKAIATHPRILSLLSRLYGRTAHAFQTLNFPVGTQQRLHSDSYHFSSHPDRFMCGVWVALEDIDLDNGPLVYAPGSHAWPTYYNEHLGVNPAFQPDDSSHYVRVTEMWAELVKEHGVALQRFTGRQGQALIWTANLLHGGDRQHDLQRTRWSQVTHYYFGDCCYYSPVTSEPFFGQINFREFRDLVTGEPARHLVGGHEIPIDFRNGVRPRAKTPKDEKLNRKLGLPEGFDPERYLELNPDVKAAGADARQHYVSHGRQEGRPWQ